MGKEYDFVHTISFASKRLELRSGFAGKPLDPVKKKVQKEYLSVQLTAWKVSKLGHFFFFLCGDICLQC